MSEHTPLPRNDKGEIILNEVFDAKVWAQEFSKRFPMILKDDDGVMPTEELMLAWFANSIMAGYDHANAKLIAENKRLRNCLAEEVDWLKEIRSADLPTFVGLGVKARIIEINQALNESE